MVVNELVQLTLGGTPCIQVIIRELCCHYHRDGWVVRKDLTRAATILEGKVPDDEAARQAIIDKRKRQQEEYVLRGGAKKVWWELPPGLKENDDES